MPPKSGLASRQITPILSYIHNNLEADLRVAALARMADLSAPHFCRLFKKRTGFSPHRYILLHRIERAKELLEHSDLNLLEIALQCGFYDQSHFNLQFRNFIGMTPKCYRQQTQTGD